MLRSVALAGLLLSVGIPAHALTPVAQDRHVHARYEDAAGYVFELSGVPLSETVGATNYAPFSASVDGNPFSFPLANIEILAEQNSTIGADQLDASGRAESFPGANNPPRLVTGESVYSVTFQVDAPRSYALSGRIDLTANRCEGASEAYIRLSGASGVLAQVSYWIPGVYEGSNQYSAPLVTSVELAPGTYTLEARSSSEALGGVGTHTGEVCLIGPGRLTSHYEVLFAPVAPVPVLPLPWVAALAATLAFDARRRFARR